jgi:Tfp pilus assembly protein PilV
MSSLESGPSAYPSSMQRIQWKSEADESMINETAWPVGQHRMYSTTTVRMDHDMTSFQHVNRLAVT